MNVQKANRGNYPDGSEDGIDVLEVRQTDVAMTSAGVEKFAMHVLLYPVHVQHLELRQSPVAQEVVRQGEVQME